MSFEMREGEMHSLSFLYEEGQSNSSDTNLQPISFLTKALNFEQSDISLDIFPNSLSKRHSVLSSLQASKISSDLHESWKYSKEVSEIFPGHTHAPSVLVKSGAQNYNGILNELNLERDSMTPDSQDFEEGSIDYSLTDEEDLANKETILNYPTSKVQAEFSTPTAKNSLIIPTKEEIKGVRASTIYTNLSSDSSAMITSYLSNNSSKLTARKNTQNKPEPEEEEFEVVEIKPKRLQTDRSVHASVRKSTLAFPNLLYCPTCNEDTYSIINFQVQNLGFFDSVKFFFQAFRCCREVNSLSQYQEVVHTCRKCKNVLARVRFA